MVEDRKLAVLRAIVEDYVSTQEPVGSKALVERHQLGVSPATVRNDMAALEEEGFIAQPHTSAGRVPTDKGYRLFVDRLTTVKPMSAAERRAISTLLDGAIDLDDVVQRSRAPARPADPPGGRSSSTPRCPARRCATSSSSPLAPNRLLIVLILSTGRVEQRLVELAEPLSDQDLADLRSLVNRAATGEPLVDRRRRPGRARRDRAAASATSPPRCVTATLVDAMSDHRSDERVAVGGTANLARFGEGFDASIRPMLEALEEHVVLLKLLGEASVGGTVTVRIGHEGPYQELASTSVVATGYGPGDAALATLGVVGPTRMDYPGTMAAVRAVARYVSRILDEG